MIIVNQEKRILNYDNIVDIDKTFGNEKDVSIIATTINNNDIVLGEYDTEERADEILDEIVNKYLEYGQIQNLVGDIKQVCNIPKKYEMPKE